jgi:uncharacterized protein YndB with AHSA1/START domain
MSAQLQINAIPVAKAEMLIRKPPKAVFEAIVDPKITTRFWFTKSTGRLEAGKEVTWTWEMYNASNQVKVKNVEPHHRIVLEWPYGGVPTTMEWILTPYEGDATYLSVTNSGFAGDGDKVVKDALEATGGFTWVLAGLKAFLEHGIELNLVADAFPKGLREH